MHLVVNKFTLEHIAIGIVIAPFALTVQALELAHILITVEVIRGFASASEQGYAENEKEAYFFHGTANKR